MNLIGNPSYADLIDENNPDRRFKLVYPNKEIFYLTDAERDFVLSQVNHGQRFVQVGEHTLTSSFTVLYPIRNKPEKKEYESVGKNTLKEV